MNIVKFIIFGILIIAAHSIENKLISVATIFFLFILYLMFKDFRKNKNEIFFLLFNIAAAIFIIYDVMDDLSNASGLHEKIYFILKGFLRHTTVIYASVHAGYGFGENIAESLSRDTETVCKKDS